MHKHWKTVEYLSSQMHQKNRIGKKHYAKTAVTQQTQALHTLVEESRL